jgi:hypothetical protein
VDVGLEILRLIMRTQVMLEGEKYVTGSLVLPMVEELCAGLLHKQERVQELGEAVGLEQVGGDGSDFNI